MTLTQQTKGSTSSKSSAFARLGVERRAQAGFTRSIQDRLFRLLELPPEEMERILFETY